VRPEVLATADKLRHSGRRLILVTGRRLDHLLEAFPEAQRFDRIVAENGALLFDPSTQKQTLLAEAPTAEFDRRLAEKGVPSVRGHVIVATWQPHEKAVLETIHEMGLELQVIFNRDAVMILPSGVNKASGLAYALADLRLSPHNVVAVGDAENDHALLAMAECGVSVANGLPALLERADWVTRGREGDGVRELMDALLTSDLAEVAPRLARHHIVIGTREDGAPLSACPYGESLLVAGTSGSGKSTFATAFAEALTAHGYQFCIIDPEGDYDQSALAAVVGNRKTPPRIEDVIGLMAAPLQNVAVNLLALAMADRPSFFATLLSQLQALRAQLGRPHWIIVDEAHHVFPETWDKTSLTMPIDLEAMLFITVHPEHVSQDILSAVHRVITVGQSAAEGLATFAGRLGRPAPPMPKVPVGPGEAITWSPAEGAAPVRFRMIEPQTSHQRHIRKYAEGELLPERSFYFRGPDGKLNLRAQNLHLFLQIADGIDDATWVYHLRQHDYSQWFRDHIKDDELAQDAARIESEPALSPAESRRRMRAAVEMRYTAPA
jgi:hydroxymethylpyrimidine pyrophosphatase-like HAD family hydrolase/energy-coupling factor transporter ATP-binding protein EcfA2